MYNTTPFTIIIGGIKRRIISYDEVAMLEIRSKQIITEKEYNSMFFSNLGYDKCPENLDYIYKQIPIEFVISNTNIQPVMRLTDRKYTYNSVITKLTTLKDLLDIVRFWAIGPMEQGYLLDEESSFKLPDFQFIEDALVNNLKIDRSYRITSHTFTWHANDIEMRRLHNLRMNGYYFDHCIRNFNAYANQIIVENPCTLFASAIISPDILLSIIKMSEIEAAEIADKKWYGGYSVARRDFDTVMVFKSVFKKNCLKLQKVFDTKGYKGFVEIGGQLYYENVIADEAYVKPINDRFKAAQTSNGLNMDPKLKKQYVDNQEITGDDISYVYNFILKDSFHQLSDPHNPEFIELIKNLKFLLDEIIRIDSTLMSSHNRFILLLAFYLGPDSLVIYLETHKIFIVLNPSLEIQIMNLRQVTKYYQEYYHVTVLVDTSELDIGKLETPEIGRINFDLLEK